MESHLTFRIVPHGSREYEETVALRDAILRRPLGLVFDPEQLGAEGSDVHLACYRDGELVGCLILVPNDDGEVKMRQVAVRDDVQRSGVGRRLVTESERIARELGFDVMVLNARLNAVPFYEKLGYEPVGELFEEVTIPHRAMRKTL
jgi:predicted GNAT family N-acyltransferase